LTTPSAEIQLQGLLHDLGAPSPAGRCHRQAGTLGPPEARDGPLPPPVDDDASRRSHQRQPPWPAHVRADGDSAGVRILLRPIQCLASSGKAGAKPWYRSPKQQQQLFYEVLSQAPLRNARQAISPPTTRPSRSWASGSPCSCHSRRPCKRYAPLACSFPPSSRPHSIGTSASVHSYNPVGTETLRFSSRLTPSATAPTSRTYPRENDHAIVQAHYQATQDPHLADGTFCETTNSMASSSGKATTTVQSSSTTSSTLEKQLFETTTMSVELIHKEDWAYHKTRNLNSGGNRRLTNSTTRPRCAEGLYQVVKLSIVAFERRDNDATP